MDTKDFLDQEVKKSGLSFKDWYWTIYLLSDHWQNLRKLKLAQAKYKCQCCKKALPLDIHHLNYKHIFDVLLSDLLACCRRCHRGAEKYQRLMKQRQKDHERRTSYKASRLDRPNQRKYRK